AYEESKGLFSRGFTSEDDDMPPFFLPCDVGVEVVDGPKNALEVVTEEEEGSEEESDDDFSAGFEVGGIKITFTPPQPDTDSLESESSSCPISSNEPVSSYTPFDDEEESLMSFSLDNALQKAE